MMDIDLIYSEIDSQRFGYKIGKCLGTDFSENPKNEVQKFIDNKFDLIIARVDFNNKRLINNLENLGFRIKDCQITYRKELSDQDDFQFKKSGHIIREFNEGDVHDIVQVASKAFENYGHYYENQELDKDKCKETYEDWAFNSCTNINVADKIFVAEMNNKVVGFLSFKIYETQGKRFAAGGMGAVDQSHRGVDLFPRLVKRGLDWGREIELDWEEHNVLINNYSVNRSFNKMNFKPNNAMITMHAWLK